MRSIFLLSLIFIGVSSFLWFSNQEEKVIFSEEIELNKCKRQFPIVVPPAYGTDLKRKIRRKDLRGELLDLRYLGLRDFPNGLFSNIDCITALNAGSNEFVFLPKGIQDLEYLRKIDLNVNDIKAVEDGYFERFQYLRVLNMSNNKLTSFKSSSSSINELYLSKNKFTVFPKELTKIPNLRTLDLSENQFTELPKLDKGDFIYLRRLYLSGNELDYFPKQLGVLPQLSELTFTLKKDTTTLVLDGFPMLKWLNAGENGLGACHIKAKSGRMLEEINLSNNNLEYFRVYDTLIYVTSLSLANNKLESVPSEIRNLPNLQKLRLTNNILSDEKELEDLKLTKLRKLYIESNGFKRFPDLSSFESLEAIDVSHNLITTFPKSEYFDTISTKSLTLDLNEIKELNLEDVSTSIKALSIQSNHLEKVFGNKQLPHLTKLSLASNQELTLFTIQELEQMPNLKYLNLSNTGIKGEDFQLIRMYCEDRGIELK